MADYDAAAGALTAGPGRSGWVVMRLVKRDLCPQELATRPTPKQASRVGTVRKSSPQEGDSNHKHPLGHQVVILEGESQDGRVILQQAINGVEDSGPGRDILPLLLGMEFGNEGWLLVGHRVVAVQGNLANLGGTVGGVGGQMVKVGEGASQEENVAELGSSSVRAINLSKANLNSRLCGRNGVHSVLLFHPAPSISISFNSSPHSRKRSEK